MIQSDVQVERPAPELAEQAPRSRLRIPFLTTTPLTDVGLLFMLLPLWWAVGLDQLIWAPALFAIAGKLVLTRGWRLSYPAVLKWLALFVVAQLISALFIDQAFRYMTFLRTLSAYISAMLLVIILVNSIERWQDIDYLLKSILVMMGSAALVGYLGFTFLWRPSFTTPLGTLLENVLPNSMYTSRLMDNTIGGYNRLFGVVYFRARSLFMFGTMYSTALAISVPILLFLLRNERGKPRRILLWIVLGLVVLNQLSSGGRVALVSCLFGGLIFAQPWKHIMRMPRWLKVTAVAVILLGGGVLLTPPGQQLFNSAMRSAVYARQGSIGARTRIYQDSIAGIERRPIFGFGTERDREVKAAKLPTGSHSYYLGVLYKHGIVGLICFLGLWWTLWRDTRPPREREGAESELQRRARNLLRLGRWIMIALLINSITDVLDLDMLLMMVMWGVFVALLMARTLYERADRAQTRAVDEPGAEPNLAPEPAL
jgi:O-antigen ligase